VTGRQRGPAWHSQPRDAPGEDAADPTADPTAVIVGLVSSVEPGLDLAALEEVVARAGGGRAKRRRLAQALADRPALLTDGRSPAPRPVGDLLIALRQAGATTVSPPVCAVAGCGRSLRALRRRGQDWYCAGCTRAWEPCTACGKTRNVNTRGRDGQAYCQFCGPAETADPVDAVVRVVTTIAPGLAAEVVAGAVTDAAR
jgi:hypothetical protein